MSKTKVILQNIRKSPENLRFQGFFGGENRICPVAKPRGSVATPLQNTTVAKRYVISLSCSRSIEKGLPLQAFAWRREQDLNLRRLLTSHAFQACALNRSTISPSILLPKYDTKKLKNSQLYLITFATKLLKRTLPFHCQR